MISLRKHLTWTWRIAAAVLFAAAAPAAMAAGIAGSKHDFSTTGPSATYKSTSGQTQVCIFCHTPHAASATPLWNHAPSTALTYTLYASPTLTAAMAQPGGVSKLCLSCHDGTVAVDSFGGVTGSKMALAPALLGTDLSNDHPIGFTYDGALALADVGLKDPGTTTVIIGTGGVGNTGTIAAKMLFAGKMECASCHDVHNSNRVAVTDKLVTMTTAGSALCIACHNK